VETDSGNKWGRLRDRVAIKIHTIKFIEEKIDELPSAPSMFEDELYMFYSQGVDTLKGEIIDLEKEIHGLLAPGWEFDEIEALKEAAQMFKVMLFEHNLMTVSGGNAWLVQEKLAEAYSHGIKKLEDEIVESKNDL
tara:strand:- start:251 stop:658 length:408 start_codon:yes stop_codon:yes gene_type:complete